MGNQSPPDSVRLDRLLAELRDQRHLAAAEHPLRDGHLPLRGRMSAATAGIVPDRSKGVTIAIEPRRRLEVAAGMYGISADQITEATPTVSRSCSSAAAASYRSPRPTPGSPPGCGTRVA